MKEFVPRPEYEKRIKKGLEVSKVVVLQGPRQCGKTSLARQFENVPDSHYFDMDDPTDQRRLAENPMMMLGMLRGMVIIDEAQKKPDLFSILRVLVDRQDNNTSFLLLGSTSSLLLKQVSESLAGRAYIIDMSGFSVSEIGKENWKDLWVKGGYPQPFLMDEKDSMDKRQNYLKQITTRDLRDLGETKITDVQIMSLLELVATSQGGNWNHSFAAQHLGVNQKTIQRYMDLFRASFLVRCLPLFATNTAKRVRRAPKYFLRDSGLFHALTGIYDFQDLQRNRLLGASWEGFAMEQVCVALQLDMISSFTWGLQSGAEVDLVFKNKAHVYGIEFKHNEAPGSTKSLASGVENIPLKHAWIVHSGMKSYPINERVTAVSISELEIIQNQLMTLE